MVSVITIQIQVKGVYWIILDNNVGSKEDFKRIELSLD